MEEWKEIINGKYLVSSFGRIKNPLTNRILKTPIGRGGYYTISLFRKPYRVHRLVSEAFIKNPNNYREINHIDGDKLNNNINNLEWCTRSHNMKHLVSSGKYDFKKILSLGKLKSQKQVVDLNTGVFYDSVKIACDSLNKKYENERRSVRFGKSNLVFL